MAIRAVREVKGAGQHLNRLDDARPDPCAHTGVRPAPLYSSCQGQGTPMVRVGWRCHGSARLALSWFSSVGVVMVRVGMLRHHLPMSYSSQGSILVDQNDTYSLVAQVTSLALV